MTVSTPDIQALIEEANAYLANWGGDYVQRGEDMVRRLAAALSALSSPAETEWEYGIRNTASLRVGYPWDREYAISSSARANAIGGPVYPDLYEPVRRRRATEAGPWIEVTK